MFKLRNPFLTTLKQFVSLLLEEHYYLPLELAYLCEWYIYAY